MSRAYLRLDPGFFDRKVIDQKYPPGAAIALVGALCHAEHQPKRGRFRDERVLRSLLGPLSKWVPFLIAKRDLVKVRGELYVDGWDEWQEGDWKVGERVKRIRNRIKAEQAEADVTPTVTPDVTPDVTVPTDSDESVETVYNLSDGGRQSVIDSGSGSGKQESGSPDVDPLTPSAQETRKPKSVNGFATPGDVDWRTAMTPTERDAWAGFGSEWSAFRDAWLGRGLRRPPHGNAEDDPDAANPSQRALLYSILDARPSDLPRWVSEAPKRASASQVIAYCVERWHAERDEATRRADEQEAEAKRSKDAEVVDPSAADPRLVDWLKDLPAAETAEAKR
jgi:hypothetical protein